jgi:hypothetical protein
VKIIWFSYWMPGGNLDGSHLEWEPLIRFSWRFSSSVLTEICTQQKTNQRRLKTDWRELPNTNKDWRPHLKFVIYLLWALQIWIFFSVYRTKIMILTRLLQIWPWIMKMLNFSFSSLTSLVLQSFISATLSWLQVSWSWHHTNAVLWRETIRIY